MNTHQIKINELSIFSGKNIYSHKPVIRMTIDIGDLGDTPTKDIPGFNDKLLELLPGLRTNCCGLGYEGGFVDRLREGTYLGHVLEHVILEMQYMLGYNVSYGKTRTIVAPSQYYLVFEYENEVCGHECAKVAVFILNHLIGGHDIRLSEFISYLRRITLETELGPSTGAIVSAARGRGIPVTRIGNESLVRLGYGKNSRLVESTMTDATACICADISSNKQLSKQLLSEQRIPVPQGKVVYSEISALMAAGQIGTPVVIKPLDSNQGKGVHLNLTSPQDIKAAFACASRYSNGVLVERFVPGHDYRVLVIGNEVKAVARRVPAHVVGDGLHTIRELVDIVNEDPNRGDKHELPLTKLRLDDVALSILKKDGLTPETVIDSGEIVALRENGNISTGGTAIDCTDQIHPDNAALAIRAANAIGIDIAGIDFVTADISQSILDTGGVIVEVNTAPGIRMHLYPSTGKPRNVGEDIVNFLFPTAESFRFPIVSVTGTNGKTTTARLIQHTLSKLGHTVGLTSTGGTYVGDRLIAKGDNSGPQSARALLANKQVTAAVLETARGGIVREGLGYDWADVGVITNITADHLGLDGINTLEELAFVKALVAEAVKDGGAVVLNALDAMTPLILARKQVTARPILFYNAPETPELVSSRACVRVYCDEGWIRIKDGDKVSTIAHVNEIPITLGGLITCNIDNALAAAGALYGLGVPIDKIRSGLVSFSINDGRFEIYDFRNMAVMLDYGHNSAGVQEALKVCRNLGFRRLTGILGMPGDRTDEAIREVASQCAGVFDRIIIKEDADKRGRADGEVARLMYDAVVGTGFSPSEVFIIPCETEALRRTIADAEDGELITVFYEKLTPLRNLLEEIGAVRRQNDMTGTLNAASYQAGQSV
jgi:cyanophycin synthetase